MLSWICPDCGCDCAPTEQECPECADLVQAGMVALARTIEEEHRSVPPDPQIPMQETLLGPPPSIAPRCVLATARQIEPEPEPVEGSAPVRPRMSETTEAPQVPAIAVPQPEQAHRRAALPGWLISLIVATVLSLGGAAVIRNMEGDHKAQAASGAASSGDSSIEVTGLRVLGGPRFGSQLQYIVVNHSATQLANVNLRINVLSTASNSTGRPLFSISTSVNSLGPYSSRELSSDIEDVQAAQIPDWGRLKTQVEIVAQ